MGPSSVRTVCPSRARRVSMRRDAPKRVLKQIELDGWTQKRSAPHQRSDRCHTRNSFFTERDWSCSERVLQRASTLCAKVGQRWQPKLGARAVVPHQTRKELGNTEQDDVVVLGAARVLKRRAQKRGFPRLGHVRFPVLRSVRSSKCAQSVSGCDLSIEEAESVVP